ncbi:MAG: RES family NAD+ phosphorylase [Flavobacteriales bacterium]
MDLETVSHAEVMAVMARIEKVMLFGFTLPVDSYVIRVRPSKTADCWSEWLYEERISYIRDPSIVAPYNRASFEGDPMFYGCAGQPDQFKEAVHVAYNEVSNLFNDPTYTSTEEHYVGGLWKVVEPVNVIALVHHQAFTSKNERLKDLNDHYQWAVKKDPDMAERSLRLSEFLATDFAKPVTKGWQYKISAAFATHVKKLGIDGLMYPSVKADGDTSVFNVALTPTSVDNKLKLKEVSAVRVVQLSNGSVTPLPSLHDPNVSGKFQWQEYPVTFTSAMVEREVERRERLGIPIPRREQR